MHPKHRQTQSYLLHCMYNWGGQVKIDLLLNTNVDLALLMQTDIRSYIQLVREQLAPQFDFANYNSDPEITSINGIVVDQDEPLDQFISRFITESGLEKISHFLQSGYLEIGVNSQMPSVFLGYSLIPEDDAKVLNEYMPTENVIRYFA